MSNNKWEVPPPSMEPNKPRAVPDGCVCQWPVAHVYQLHWYQTSDSMRDVFQGYFCKHCRCQVSFQSLDQDVNAGCPAFECDQCRRWYEAPLAEVVLPGADELSRLCLECLRDTAKDCAGKMAALIAAAEAEATHAK